MARRDRTAYRAAYYQRNREKALANAAAYALANPEKVEAWSDARTSEQRATVRAKSKIKHGGVQRIAQCDAHVREWNRFNAQQARRTQSTRGPRSQHSAHVWLAQRHIPGVLWRARYQHDIDFRVAQCLRRQQRKHSKGRDDIAEAIRCALARGGDSRRIENTLGYSIPQLRAHLERQFKRGMSWENYGPKTWHIDHILPAKCFDLATEDGVCAYWSLSNLRPLKASANIAKGARVEFLT